MQSATAKNAPAFEIRPITATIFGIPAAMIVLAALSDSSAPIFGSGRGALIWLWAIATIMCGMGMASMGDRFGRLRALSLGAPFGILALALILSALVGWDLLLKPIADAVRGSGPAVSLDRAAIVGVGGIMVLKWAFAWLSYLPRMRS
jgi:hypothetical protein